MPRGASPGERRGGRKAGVPNKTTAEVKAALVSAFAELGGIPSLVSWARENPTEFYKLWGKLLPQELKANVSTDQSVRWTIEVIGGEDEAAPQAGRLPA